MCLKITWSRTDVIITLPCNRYVTSSIKWPTIETKCNTKQLRLKRYKGLCSSQNNVARMIYSISQEICTRFCCALLCCGYAIVHNEFTWSIYPYSPGLLCCHWGNGAIVRLPQCQWSKPDGCGKISQCITTTKHSKAKTVCIFLGIYCKSADYVF